MRQQRNEPTTPEGNRSGWRSALPTLASAATVEQEQHHHSERREEALEHGPARRVEQIDRLWLGHLDLARA